MVVVPVEIFKEDDGPYLNWIAANSDGFVLNIQRGFNPSDARVHRAVCWTISRPGQRPGALVGPYVKVCASDLEELDRWVAGRGLRPIRRCGTCHPPVAPGRAKTSPRPNIERQPRPGPREGGEWLLTRSAPSAAGPGQIRAEVDEVLREASEQLAPIILGLFMMNGQDWLDQLNAIREKSGVRPVRTGSGVFQDRRVLFGVVGHQWLMIDQGFVRDPGGPARKLLWIASRRTTSSSTEVTSRRLVRRSGSFVRRYVRSRFNRRWSCAAARPIADRPRMYWTAGVLALHGWDASPTRVTTGVASPGKVSQRRQLDRRVSDVGTSKDGMSSLGRSAMVGLAGGGRSSVSNDVG